MTTMNPKTYTMFLHKKLMHFIRSLSETLSCSIMQIYSGHGI